jgi:hypothetical protein
MEIDALHVRFQGGDPQAALKISVASENVLGACQGCRRTGLDGGGQAGKQAAKCCVILHTPATFAAFDAAGVLAGVLPEVDAKRVSHQVGGWVGRQQVAGRCFQP